MRSRTSPLGPALLFLVPLAACGGDAGGGDDRGRLERPALIALGEAPMPTERIDRLPVPDGFGKWSLAGRPGTTPGAANGERIVALAGEPGPALLRVPGRFPAAEMDAVRVTGVFPGAFRVTLQLSSEEDPNIQPFRPPSLPTRDQEGVQTLEFSLERLRGRLAVFDRLLLQLDGPPRPIELHAIEIVDSPEGRLLARPGTPPEMVDLDDGVGRSGNGLTEEVPIGCRFRVEDAADTLSFAVALAPGIRLWSGKPRVLVRVGPPGGKVREEVIELEAERGQRPAWHTLAVPLSDWVGLEIEARFEYRCEAPQPGACVLAEVQVGRPCKNPPTVVLVSSDTHRGDHLGCAGAGVALETPALDALAEKGLLFEQCWSSTNVTSPSHVAILTAVHPRDTRLVTNVDRLSPRAHTLAEAFRDAGWATIAAVSVRHLGPRGTNLGQGFDRMLAPLAEPWPAEVPVQQLLKWIEEERGKPLFAFLHVFDAHYPYTPPSPYDRRYYPSDRDPADPTLPVPEIEPGCAPADLFAGGVRDVELPLSQYRAEISYLDSQLARLFQVERVRRGLIAATGDHGEILAKEGSYFNHGELYPDTLHVPLVLGGGALPADVAQRRVAARVDQLGLSRTLLDLAGLSSVEFPGRNLLEALDRSPDASPAHFSLSANGNSAAIADGDRFLVLHLRDHKSTVPPVERAFDSVELYDLAADPECLRDLSGQEAETVARLKARLIEWLDGAPPTSLSSQRIVSPEELKELVELGYADHASKVDDDPWYERR